VSLEVATSTLLTRSLHARPKERDKEEHGLARHGEPIPQPRDLQDIRSQGHRYVSPNIDDLPNQAESRKVAKPTAPPAGTAEAKAAGSATLWDGDWLEAISRRPVLIYPRQYTSHLINTG
jgi:hypothetical protein